MKIALVTEGTYPFHHGGVGVWCDQLIRGLAEHEFEVVAVTGSGDERPVWKLPRNVLRVTSVPTWGRRPHRRGSFRALSRFAPIHLRFVGALVDPEAPGAVHAFLAALRDMSDFAREGDLGAALVTNASLSRLVDGWEAAARAAPIGTRRRDVAITFADALAASDLIEHFLRPLAAPLPRVDLFHAASNGLAALVGMKGSWVHGVPFILTEHGIYLRERYLGALRTTATHPVRTLLLTFFRLVSSAAYAMADLILPGSNDNHRWQIRAGAAPGRIATVYNGIDIDAFPEAGMEPEAPTLSWLGRIDPIKDLHTLVRAFAMVRTEMPTALLRLFGSAPAGNESYLESCRALITNLGLDGAATFEGPLDDAAEAYRAGSIVLLTSVSEGFPYALLEAMGSGRATVVTNVGGMREAVGETGLVVPPSDARAVADACLTLLADQELRLRLGSAARRRVAERFTVAQCLSAYRSSYRRVGAEGRSSAVARASVEAPRVARWQAA
jgi:polysaccharide biosynthesis protein PelF